MALSRKSSGKKRLREGYLGRNFHVNNKTYVVEEVIAEGTVQHVCCDIQWAFVVTGSAILGYFATRAVYRVCSGGLNVVFKRTETRAYIIHVLYTWSRPKMNDCALCSGSVRYWEGMGHPRSWAGMDLEHGRHCMDWVRCVFCTARPITTDRLHEHNCI